MKKRTYFTIVLLAAFSIAVMWLLWHRSLTQVSTSSSDASKEIDVSAARTTRNHSVSSPVEDRVSSGHQSSSLPAIVHSESPAGFQQWLQQVQPPIEFYGKVLDQAEQPVGGASVEFGWTQLHPEVDFRRNTSSDKDGLFALAGVNASALDVRVSKPGYYTVRSLNRNNFNYVALPGCDPFQPDPRNPAIFHLRKKGPGVDLITSRRGVSPELEISGLTNGSVVRVNFFTRKAAPDGQLELSAVKPPRNETPTRWSFRMSIPSGGFAEANEEFPFKAPVSGYTPTIEFTFTAGETNWANTLRKRYYIVFGGPPMYGRIEIQTGIYRGVSLSYAINPDGSRNLEPK